MFKKLFLPEERLALRFKVFVHKFSMRAGFLALDQGFIELVLGRNRLLLWI